jgi:hypothetical protein
VAWSWSYQSSLLHKFLIYHYFYPSPTFYFLLKLQYPGILFWTYKVLVPVREAEPNRWRDAQYFT